MNKTVRTILFWMFMLFLAVVLWRTTSGGRSSKSAPEITYSEFVDQLSKNNVSEVTIKTQSNSALLLGRLREPPTEFEMVTARENIPELTRLLTEKKVPLQFREGSPQDATTIILNLAPILLFVAVWILMIRQMQKKKDQGPGGQGPPYQ